MKLFLFLISFLSPAVVLTQSLPDWSADTVQAQRMWALYSDAIRNKEFIEAVEPYHWLIAEAPGLSAALYIQAEKMFNGLLANATDQDQEAALKQQALQAYDLRMQHFHNESIMNRKAFTAYQYYREQPERYPTLLSIFEEAFEINPSQFSAANLVAYMDVIRKYRQANSSVLSDEEVLRRYDRITEALKQHQDQDFTEKQTLIDKLLIATVTMDCATIEEKFGKPFLQDSTQLERAKKVLALALAYQCSAAPFFLTALKVVFHHEPSVGTARTFARLSESRGDNQLAEYYWQQAITLSQEEAERTALWYSLAQYYQRHDQKMLARTAAREVIQRDPTFKEAYRLIGDLYFSSNEGCKAGKRMTDDRAVYWAAYEMYQKAGRDDLMEQAQQQFPLIEQIFQEGLAEGETLRVGCWIQEQVTVRSRPSFSP